MKFNELDQKMRVFETAADYCVLPGVFMVARLDGRSFTRLTKETCQFEAPFDERLRDMMVETADSLMNCGFRVRYAYTESDEISLLFEQDERLFGRKLRKYNSTLAGEASATFSLLLGKSSDIRLPHLAAAQRFAGRGLFSLAKRGCRPERLERLLLLDAPQRRPRRAIRHSATPWSFGCREKRVAFPARYQFQ